MTMVLEDSGEEGASQTRRLAAIHTHYTLPAAAQPLHALEAHFCPGQCPLTGRLLCYSPLLALPPDLHGEIWGS